MRMRWMDNRGAALVEFAIVAILLIILAMGAIDFALISKDHTMLSSAVSAGARKAALGANVTTGDITSVVKARASTLNATRISVSSYYRVCDPVSGWPEGWIAGVPSQVVPEASSVEVKVRAQYQCNRFTGTLFGANPVTISEEQVESRD